MIKLWCSTRGYHNGVGGGLRAFCNWGQWAHFLNSQGAPSLVPLPAPNIFEICDLQGPKTAQKTAQIGPDWPKWRFEGSGGPKRLEQRGTKLRAP